VIRPKEIFPFVGHQREIGCREKAKERLKKSPANVLCLQPSPGETRPAPPMIQNLKKWGKENTDKRGRKTGDGLAKSYK